MAGSAGLAHRPPVAGAEGPAEQRAAGRLRDLVGLLLGHEVPRAGEPVFGWFRTRVTAARSTALGGPAAARQRCTTASPRTPSPGQRACRRCTRTCSPPSPSWAYVSCTADRRPPIPPPTGARSALTDSSCRLSSRESDGGVSSWHRPSRRRAQRTLTRRRARARTAWLRRLPSARLRSWNRRDSSQYRMLNNAEVLEARWSRRLYRLGRRKLPLILPEPRGIGATPPRPARRRRCRRHSCRRRWRPGIQGPGCGPCPPRLPAGDGRGGRRCAGGCRGRGRWCGSRCPPMPWSPVGGRRRCGWAGWHPVAVSETLVAVAATVGSRPRVSQPRWCLWPMIRLSASVSWSVRGTLAEVLMVWESSTRADGSPSRPSASWARGRSRSVSRVKTPSSCQATP